MDTKPKSLRLTLAVLVLNALLAYPILFYFYKQFNYREYPMEDIPIYLSMVDQGPAVAQPPFRYRVLVPEVVKAMRVLPGYNVRIDYTEDPVVQKDFFHFMLLNFGLIIAVSGLLFRYLRGRVGTAFAWMGSLLYILSFNSFMGGYVPLSDAGAHLAILVGIILLEKRRPVLLLLLCLFAVFIKETVLLVLIPWIAVHAVGDWKRLWYWAYVAPAGIAYVAVARAFPAASKYMYSNASTVLDPAIILKNAFLFLSPATYSRQFVFHVGLGNLPLLVALGVFACLRFKGVKVPVNRGLWVYGFMLWFALTIWSELQTGRVAFMVFPAVILFEVTVFRALYQRIDSVEPGEPVNRLS